MLADLLQDVRFLCVNSKIINGLFQKRFILTPQRKFLPSNKGGEKKKISDNSKCIQASEGVGGF
jgi:hypothetical protein